MAGMAVQLHTDVLTRIEKEQQTDHPLPRRPPRESRRY